MFFASIVRSPLLMFTFLPKIDIDFICFREVPSPDRSSRGVFRRKIVSRDASAGGTVEDDACVSRPPSHKATGDRWQVTAVGKPAYSPESFNVGRWRIRDALCEGPQDERLKSEAFFIFSMSMFCESFNLSIKRSILLLRSS